MSEENGERRHDHLSRRDFYLAERAAESALRKFGPSIVDETLTRLGIPAKDPIAMQRRMAYLEDASNRASDPEVKADREWTRKNRARCEKVQDAAISKASALIVGAAGVLLVLGTLAYLGLPVKIP
jgi:hypothetical protein